jgi:bidirectional [NiFe] hydrogenase diaphorase subunit
MKSVTLTIDGKRVTTPAGEKVLWAALDNGIYISNLCGLRQNPEPLTACRLCWVEIEGRNGFVTACTETVTDGMVVNTKGDGSLRLAKRGFELLMASHALDCGHCLKNGDCELQKIAHHLHISLKSRALRKLTRDLPADDSQALFTYTPDKCVLCGRCVWTCRKLGNGVLGYSHRGFMRRVATFGDAPMGASACNGCLECVAVCPTGALVSKAPPHKYQVTNHKQ